MPTVHWDQDGGLDSKNHAAARGDEIETLRRNSSEAQPEAIIIYAASDRLKSQPTMVRLAGILPGLLRRRG